MILTFPVAYIAHASVVPCIRTRLPLCPRTLPTFLSPPKTTRFRCSPFAYYLSISVLLSATVPIRATAVRSLTLSLNSPRIPDVHPSGRQPCLALAASSVARIRVRVFVAPIRLDPYWPPTFSFLAEVNAFSQLFSLARLSTTIDLEAEILSYDSVRFDVAASQRSHLCSALVFSSSD